MRPNDAPQGQNNNLRNWKERNQGLMPKADPRSKIPTKDRDFASPEESTDTCGAVTGEPGALGADASGPHGGTGIDGATGAASPRSAPRR